MADNVDFDISGLLETAIAFTEDALARGGKVLVHCQKGRSRSVLIGMAYLIYKYGLSSDEALAQCLALNSEACPNIAFIHQLK